MVKPFVMIELDRPRKLRYGLNALVLIEEMTGKEIPKLNLQGVGIKDMRAMLYAGLVHEDPDLTPEMVGNLVDEHGDITEITKKMGDALSAAFGDKPKNGARPGVKA